MASLLNLSGSALMDRFVTKQNAHLSFASATINALTTDGTKAVQSVTSDVQGLTYTYSSSDTSIASISGSTITIHKSGSVTITASFAGNESYNPASASYTLAISKANVTLSFTNATVNTTTETSTLSVQTVTSSVQGLTITYSSGNSSVATISGTTITIVDVGSATITASFAGNETYNSASASYSLVVAAAPVIYNFAYTGAAQSQFLAAGTYKLEVWGAQGGSAGSAAGGKGGYAKGILVVTSDVTAYIYVGGKGMDASGAGAVTGGFNGGGNSYGTTANYYGGSGGGGTDIRIKFNALEYRVIVAGGGGGAGSYNSSTKLAGGYGGGISGGAGSPGTNANSGRGGTSSKGGDSYYGNNLNASTYGTLAGFGVGGGAKSSTTSYRTVGGGGGWYGGGYSQRAGAGGGSGYVSTSGSYVLSSTENIAGNQSFPAPSGGTETGHEGNGYVRITKQ